MQPSLFTLVRERSVLATPLASSDGVSLQSLGLPRDPRCGRALDLYRCRVVTIRRPVPDEVPPHVLHITIASPPTATLYALDEVLACIGVEVYLLVRAQFRRYGRARHLVHRFPSQAPVRAYPC